MIVISIIIPTYEERRLIAMTNPIASLKSLPMIAISVIITTYEKKED